MDEFSTYPAAKLASLMSASGPTIEQATCVRDKVKMKRTLVANRIKTPRQLAYCDISEQTNFPIVVKPRSMAGSVGVNIIRTYTYFENANYHAENFAYHAYTDMSNIELHLEEFIEFPIFHIDGVCINREPQFWSISEYVGSQLDYLSGSPFGSFSHDRTKFPNTSNMLRNIALALNLHDGAFHIEAFLDKNGEFIILEVAARPGGGQILRMIYLEYGIDLSIAHFESQVFGKFTDSIRRQNSETSFAWLSVPYANSASSKNLLAKVDTDLISPAQLVWSQSAPIGISIAAPFYSHARALYSAVYTIPREIAKAHLAHACRTVNIEQMER